MSHAATKWALDQRGIKPAAKILLWHLCDRYHPDNGCFPSQERLAEDAEISRSSLNAHLAALEAAGLIAREVTRDPVTKRQERTRYRFPFEVDFAPTAAEPCAESGHGAESENGPEPSPENGESRVRNPDTNLVREPVSEPVDQTAREANISQTEEQELRGAAGAAIDPTAPNLFVMATPMRWKASGMDWRLDVLPAVRAAASRAPPGRIRSWDYFTGAIADFHAARTKPMPEGKAHHHGRPKRQSSADVARNFAAFARERERDGDDPRPDARRLSGAR